MNKHYLSFVAVVFAIASVFLSVINICTKEQVPEYETVAEEIPEAQVIYHTDKRSIFAYDVPSDFKAIDCSLEKETQEFAYYTACAYSIDFEFVMAVISAESNFNPDAVSDAGDYGLMQINKCNKNWLAEEIGTEDLLDPYENIHAGTYILANLFEKYEGDANKVLMSYNMGEAGARKLWNQGIYETNYTKRVWEAYEGLVTE